MLIGYVSDQRYSALADVCVEFLGTDGASWVTHSRATGAIHTDLPAGNYRVILQHPGFGAKSATVQVPAQLPYQFRLLSDELSGYAWPKWVRAGEAAEFRVHAVEPFHVTLWRYGKEPELVQDLGWHDEHAPRAMMQITPDGDFTSTGVCWNQVGYGNPMFRPMANAPSRSGLYYFRAQTASGARFAFPWIVAPARPLYRLAVLASNLTWNAYNAFGGRSNYIHADRLPATPTVNARQDLPRYDSPVFGTWGHDAYAPLSFDRPEPFNHIEFEEKITDRIEGRQACHLAPAEWRLLGWLERQGFDFDYYAESQLDDGTLDLSRYRALVLAVHPEYWTRSMYERVKRWVQQEKGRLVYLGGNGLNCEVTLNNSGTMTCHNGNISGLWPSEMSGYESRFAMRNESEAHLLGVVFTPSGAMSGAPYRVVDSKHWVFAGTGLHAGDTFGHQSRHARCPGGASGHETDKTSTSSPHHLHLLAQGMNADGGGAEMVIFDTASGGCVFSVGSISYCASLWVDDAISRITDNVLRKFTE